MLEPRWLALLPLDNPLLSPVESKNFWTTFPNNARIGNLRRAFRPFPIVRLLPDTPGDALECKEGKPGAGGTTGGEGEVREMMRGDVEDVRALQSQVFKTNPHSTAFYVQLLSAQDSLGLVIYASSPSTPTPPYSYSPPLPNPTTDPTGEQRLIAQISAKLLENLSLTSMGYRSMIPRVYIISLVVSPEYERRGYGRKIFYDLLRRLLPLPTPSTPPLPTTHSSIPTPAEPSKGRGRSRRKVFVSLHCAVDNIKGRAFYASLGLKENGVVRAYYARTRDGMAGADAVVVQGIVSVFEE